MSELINQAPMKDSEVRRTLVMMITSIDEGNADAYWDHFSNLLALHEEALKLAEATKKA